MAADCRTARPHCGVAFDRQGDPREWAKTCQAEEVRHKRPRVVRLQRQQVSSRGVSWRDREKKSGCQGPSGRRREEWEVAALVGRHGVSSFGDENGLELNGVPVAQLAEFDPFKR